MTRAALVGVSGYGRWHLLMALEQALLGRLKLVGATVINAREQAGVCRRLARLGVPLFDSFEAMMIALDGGVELLLLPTGIQWHARMTLAGLRAGAHVLVEKPVAATLQDVDTVIAAQKAASRIVAVGFQDLYVPAAHDIKRRVLQGEIGRLRRIVVRGQWPRSSAYYARNTWAGRLRVDGDWVLDSPVSNAFAHFLMLAMFWAGDAPESVADLVALDGELYRASQIESFDTVCLRIVTNRNVPILFYASHAGAEDVAPEVQLVGDEGGITWIYERAYTVARRGQPEEIRPVPDQLDTRLHVLDAVMDRLAGGNGFVVRPELARAHTRLINALHERLPIRRVEPAHIDVVRERGAVSHRIRGLDTLIAAAASDGALFGEFGAPWAARSRGPQPLDGYDRFGGTCAG